MSARVRKGLYQNVQLQTNNASKAADILSARFFRTVFFAHMNREWKCFRYCHLLNVIDLKSHFDKIKCPGTIRDLFHTFWILCEDESKERQETVGRESNYFYPQNLRTWRVSMSTCSRRKHRTKNSVDRTKGTDIRLRLLQGRISEQKGWCFLQQMRQWIPCALSVINNNQFAREGTEDWFQCKHSFIIYPYHYNLIWFPC